MTRPQRTAEYSDLREISASLGLAYGPVASRRLGSSLGINLLGSKKICSYDCVYCELGPTEMRMNQAKQDDFYPSPEEIDNAARELIRNCIEREVQIDNLTISGNGEPTLHPKFLECVDLLLKVRSDMLPNTKLVVLSNGAHCDNKRIVQGLNKLDERMIKLDAGSETMFKLLNRPLVRSNISKVTSGARKLKDIIVQSLFVKGAVDNSGNEDIEEWLEVIGILKPKAVHLTTISRVPTTAGLIKADEDTLYTIASKLKRKLQVEILVFP